MNFSENIPISIFNVYHTVFVIAVNESPALLTIVNYNRTLVEYYSLSNVNTGLMIILTAIGTFALHTTSLNN